MDLIPRTSYINKFKALIEFFYKNTPYNGWDTDCADMFRHDEWMLIDDADYAHNTYQDLVESIDSNEFKTFLDEVIASMKYTVSQIED